MGSDKFPFGLVLGREQASGGYSCSEQYEWQNLTLRQKEQAKREQPHCGSTLNYSRDRVEDSVAIETSHDLHNSNDRRNGGYHDHSHAYLHHSSKWGKLNLSPGHVPISCQWTDGKRSMHLDRVCEHAKGNGHVHAAVRLGELLSSNQGSSTQNRHHQEDRHLLTEVDFHSVHFSEIDKARHQSYMENFQTNSKREGYYSDHTLDGRTCDKVEVETSQTREVRDEFHAIHHEQLHLSRNCRNAYNGKKSGRQCAKWGFQGKKSNGAFVSRPEKNSYRKRHGDQLVGQRAKKNKPSENRSKEFCYLKEQDWQSYPDGNVRHSGSDVVRNDNREGNIKKIKKVGQNGAKGNSHPKKNVLTSAVCSGSKSNEKSGMFSPKYSRKTILSSTGPKQNEGSNNVKLESDKQSSLDVCTKRPRDMKSEEVLRGKHELTPVTHVGKGALLKESDNTSLSEVRRDCLILWRRLKKDNCTEAENTVQTNKKGKVQTSRIPISGRLRNGKPSINSGSHDENGSTSDNACVSSKSNEYNCPSENSKQCGGVISSGEVQKCSNGRVGRELMKSFKYLGGTNCKKSPQNTIPEQGLMCILDLPLETNTSSIILQKEQDNLSSSLSVCSGTSKAEPVAAFHPDSSVHQKVSQHDEINDHLDSRTNSDLVISSENKNKLEGDSAKCGERTTSLSTVPIPLDKKSAALCLTHNDSAKVNVSECSNQAGEITPFSATKLDKGTAGKFMENHAKISTGSNCRDIQWGAVDYNFSKIKQESSQFAHKESKKDCEPSQDLKVAPNQHLSHQSDSDRPNLCNASQNDWNSHSFIPDLNSLPSMITDEELKPFGKVTYQVNEDGTKPQNDSKSLSAPSCEPTLQEEQFKQPDPCELTRVTCEREGTDRFLSPNSHSGPSQDYLDVYLGKEVLKKKPCLIRGPANSC
ncbi:hypothetical protein GUJ93_ZPchr0003g18441 [Zizania palustris]|uniref:Uncharacterized protein n=1 Tax=Zizania palustris TaxID=103762 RepID=A0A8J5V6S1_ZIZPA|nr:hypothetical protein GUJ93_ZPchr0003g18441 [Zizania palustris]